MKCSVAIAADNERELLDAVMQHAVAVHGASDTPQFRAELKKAKSGDAKAFGWYWGLADRQDQTGAVKITKGQTLSQSDLYSMSWFVKGVDGNPKG